MDKLKAWWKAAPEWQRVTVVCVGCVLVGFVIGFVIGSP